MDEVHRRIETKESVMPMDYVLSNNKKGVPILSKEDIEQVAEWYIFRFSPKLLQDPQPLDIDFFVTNHLNLNQDFQHLSHKGIYLGMTVFQDTPVFVYNPEEKRAEIIEAKKGTVIIDASLAEKQERRYRFTMGHEGGHWILHREYFQSKAGRAIQCRSTRLFRSPFQEWTITDTIEWQANFFASALLMPRSAVHQFIGTLPKNPDLRKMPYYIREMVKAFDVSYQAAEYRLKSLGYCDQF